ILQAEQWTDGQPFVVAFGDCIIESRVRNGGHAAQGHAAEEFIPTGAPSAQGLAPSPHQPVTPLTRLIATHSFQGSSATVMTERIPRELSRRYGILIPKNHPPDDEPFQLAGVIEKPDASVAPSNFAIAARWALDSQIFDCLRRTPTAANG